MNDRDLVLHGLAIKKYSDADGVAEIIGLKKEKVQSILEEAVNTGRALKTGGNYMIQPAAQVALKVNYERDFAALRKNKEIQATYDEFELINENLKQLITLWQTVTVAGSEIPNDHSDEVYDHKIIDRIGNLHEQVEAILNRLALGVPRLAIYKTLLLRALERAEDGDIAWISDAKCMSYHTVWFEMHEDLLRILGRNRVE